MKARSGRNWVAVALIVFASLISGYYSFFIDPARELIRDDGVGKWEERMISLRQALPASVREIGYISDPEQEARVQEYSLTKYALAPIIVRQSVDYEWIIGNFTQAGFEDILSSKIPSGYTIKKLGAGIYLIHRTAP